MGFNEFWINNNGKKEQLHDVKQGVRKEQLDKKYHALFDAYDVNKDGTLEADELNGILKGLQNFAGADKVLDSDENIQAKSIFANDAQIQNADFQGFVKSVSKASADIVSSTVTPTSDGGKEVTTTYKDGTVETISYYPDGDFKFKKVDAKSVQTNYYYTVGGNFDKKLTAQQVENAVKKAYKKEQERAKAGGGIEGTGSTIAPLPYPDFKKEYLRQHNVNRNSSTKTVERHDFELSERGKRDVEVRDFVLNQYIETHQAAKEALDSMGLLDNAGALINAGAGELWNTIKNNWNGTEEEYQNFYELKDKFEPSFDKSIEMKGAQEFAQQHPENYFRGEIGQINTEKGAKFQQITEQYQNAQVLNTRLNLLKDAMKEVEQFKVDQGLLLHSPTKSEGVNPASHIVKANELLLQYFGGDKDAVDMLLNGAMGDDNAKVVKAIKDIYEETQKMNTAVLGGKSFDEVRADYQNQYKEMYGTDFVPDELTEKVMDAKATGSMVKLATITAISILITRSPMMAEVNGAIAGSAEATGAAANFIRSLVAKYGQAAVTQGVKFAMTTGTLASDVGLTLLNQVTSEKGYNGEELLESAKSSAKYIYFGSYIGAPVAEAVGNAVGKIGLAKGLMSGGATTTQGAIKTTTLTGDKVFENLLNTGKGVGQKLMVNGAKFGTDVAMFSALGIATDDQDVGEAFKEQSTFLPKLKIMNHVLEYVMGRALGGKVGAQTPLTSRPQDARMEAAIKNSGINEWTIKEVRTPNGTKYTVVDKRGVPQTYSDASKLVTAMMEKVAKAYETVAPNAQTPAKNKAETKAQETHASEVVPAETTTDKKSYVKPETVQGEVSLTEPVCAPEVKVEENGEYKVNTVLDKVYDETTIPKAKSKLKEIGLTEEEINSLDMKDASVQRCAEILNSILKLNPEMKEEIDVAEIFETLSNKENLKDFMEDAKFLTEENCEILSKHVIFEDNNEFYEILKDYNSPEKVISLLPILTQNGKHKVFASQLAYLGYNLKTSEDIAKITPERVDLMYKINDQIENKKYGIELEKILRLDDMSPELASDYIKEANRFSKYELKEIQENTLEEVVAKRKAVSDFLEQYPIDLTCKDYEGELTKLSGSVVYNLSQCTNKSEVQKFVNSLSAEARENYAGYSRFVDKGFSSEKLAKLINEYQKGDFRRINGDISDILNAMLKTDSKDYDSMIDLIEAYKGTDVLSWYGTEKYVQVANGDYKGAAKYVELAKELGMIDEYSDSLISDKNADFKTVEDCLTYVKENKIDLSNYNEYDLLRDNNWKENIGKVEFLKANGIDVKQMNLYNKFCSDLKSDIPLKEFKAKFEFLNNLLNEAEFDDYNDFKKIEFANSALNMNEIQKLHDLAKQANMDSLDVLSVLINSKGDKEKFALAEKLCVDKDFPKERIGYILRCTNKDNMILAEKLCTDKDFPKEQIDIILHNTDKDKIALVEKLCADKDFPKEQIVDILRYTNKDNIALTEKLCTDKDFPKELVVNIVNSTNKDNIALAEKLCADKDFSKEQVGYILSYTNKDNIALAEKLCTDKDFPKEQIGYILSYTNKDNIALAEKLCADKDFPKEHVGNILGYTNKDNIALAEKLCTDKDFPKEQIGYILSHTNKDNMALAEKLCADKDFPKEQIVDILKYTNKDNMTLVEKLCMIESFKHQPDKILNKLINVISSDIKTLSLSEKIDTLETLSNMDKTILDLCRQYSPVDIDAKIAELTELLGKKKDVIDVPISQQKMFIDNIIANNNENTEAVLKNFDFEQYGKQGLPLKYTREQFTTNIENLIKDLSPEEQQIVLKHFGLIKGAAGFDGLPTNKPFNDENASAKVNEVAKKVQEEIETFTAKNQINTGDVATDNVLNGLINGLPEFTSIVGKEQHGTHAYSVDIHTLKVLQSAMNDPLYAKLSDKDKTILKIAALCHDLGKRGGVVDKGHASSSAEYVAAILDKFPFPQGMKDRIIDIVDNHHWFEAYNTGAATAEDVAVRCRRPEDLLIYEILSKADFENVNKDFHISRSEGVTNQAEFDKYMQDKMKAVEDAVTKIYSRANLVFDTQFVQNGEKFPRQTIEIDGEPTELKVLNLNELKDDDTLQQYGFSTGVTKENARFTVHMTDPDKTKMESVMILTQNALNQSAWSTSLIKASNNRTYVNRRFGFVLDVDQANISEANYANTGSGYGKGLAEFERILFDADGQARTFVKDHLINELSKKGIELDDNEYAQLSKFLVAKKYTTQITKNIKIGDKIIKAADLVECLDKSRDALFEGGDIHSEIVPINPRVKGLIAKVERLEDCPQEFLEFAKRHNLPIILMRSEHE